MVAFGHLFLPILALYRRRARTRECGIALAQASFHDMQVAKQPLQIPLTKKRVFYQNGNK